MRGMHSCQQMCMEEWKMGTLKTDKTRENQQTLTLWTLYRSSKDSSYMELSTTSHDGAPLALLLVDLAINGRIRWDLQTGRLDGAVRAPEELARRVRVLLCMLRRTGEPPAGEEPRRGRGFVPSTNSRRGGRLYLRLVMGL